MTDCRLLGHLAQTFDEQVGAEMTGFDAAQAIIDGMLACGYKFVPFPVELFAREDEWREIATAPRDGSVVDLTWMEDGKPAEVWPMQWGHIQKNGLFPGHVGMWVATDGSVTWSETLLDGAPTHWRPHRV